MKTGVNANDDNDVIIIDDDNYEFQYESDGPFGTFGGKVPSPPPPRFAAGTKRPREEEIVVPPRMLTASGLPRPPLPPVRTLPPQPSPITDEEDAFGSMLPKSGGGQLLSPKPTVASAAAAAAAPPHTHTFALFPVAGEPSDGPGIVRLPLRFPGGQRVLRRFHSDRHTLREVAEFAAASLCGADAGSGQRVTLKDGSPPYTTFPLSAFARTLLDAGLTTGRSVIIVERS